MAEEHESLELAKAIVSDIAPEELALFPFFASRWQAGDSVQPAFLSREERQGGSGLPGSDIVVTYVVFALIQPVLKALGDGALTALKDMSRDTVKSLLKPYAADLEDRLRSLVPGAAKNPKLLALKSWVDGLNLSAKGTSPNP